LFQHEVRNGRFQVRQRDRQSSDASGRRGAARHAGHGRKYLPDLQRFWSGEQQACPDCGGTGKVTEGIGGA